MTSPSDSDELNFGEFSNDKLLSLLENIEKTVELLHSENAILERHFSRVTMHFHQSSIAKKTEEEDIDLKRKKKVEKKENISLLTIDQKMDIATKEVDEMKDYIEEQKKEWARVVDNYRAELECADTTLAELKKEMVEFKRDIVTNAVDSRTGKVVAEKLMRYYEEKIRAKDSFIEKVRLKNSTLRTQKNKLIQQLKQKEEMGEVLHAIDFDQLQIENSQFLQKIDEKNNELAALKLKTGNIMQTLNSYKKKLESVMEETGKAVGEMESRRQLISKLKEETQKVASDKNHILKHNHALKKELEDFKVPEVMDYVYLQAEQRQLSEREKILLRKIEIQKSELQSLSSNALALPQDGQATRVKPRMYRSRPSKLPALGA